MLKLKRSPLLMAVLVLVTVLSLFGAFLHHHDAHENHDCAVCRLVQMVSAALLFAAVFLLLAPARTQSFALSSKEAFQSLLLAVSLKDRAPPVFSF